MESIPGAPHSVNEPKILIYNPILVPLVSQQNCLPLQYNNYLFTRGRYLYVLSGLDELRFKPFDSESNDIIVSIDEDHLNIIKLTLKIDA